MAETEKAATTKRMPKGGRKGGTLFPRLNLKDALVYSKKLVAKTHTGPQPEKTILPGVFGSATQSGKIRASALKQFGLLEGGAEAYQASQLAKEIDAAPEDEQSPLLQRAFRCSKLFNQVFEVFHGDTVSKAKIEQRAKGLDVHPDLAEKCAQLLMESAVTATLGTMDGDSIVFVNVAATTSPISGEAAEQSDGSDEPQREIEGEADTVPRKTAEPDAAVPQPDNGRGPGGLARAAKAGVTVSLNVDSSSDPDKLEKQLKLLREFGVI